MPVIRRVASRGDWLIGMGGRDLKATGHCIFAMRVTDDMTFNEYWNSDRFRTKRPRRNGSRKTMVGDNVYRTDASGKWLQENSVHSQPSGEQDWPNTNHDTQTDRVLISEEFFYFGNKAPAMPPELLGAIGYKNGRGHRVFTITQCQQLLKWIKEQARERPNNLPDPFQFRMSDKRYSRSRNRLI